jgi:hypothetical protein
VADVQFEPLPAPLQVVYGKARGGEPLTLEEQRTLLAHSLVRIVEELEHICASLRLTPEEESSGG